MSPQIFQSKGELLCYLQQKFYQKEKEKITVTNDTQN